MVRILFVISCVAFFAAPLTAEAQIFRRGGVQRRFQQPPAYQPQPRQYQQVQPRQYQPQPQPRFTPAPQQPRNVIAQPTFQPSSALQANRGIVQSVVQPSVVQPSVVQLTNGAATVPPLGQTIPFANQQIGHSAIGNTNFVQPAGITIEGQFDPIVQTSGESLDLSSQVEAVGGVQPTPSLLENQPSNSMPAEIQQKPIEPVETHSILQIISK